MAGTPARKRRRILDSGSSSPERHQQGEHVDQDEDDQQQEQRRLDKGKQREVVLDEDAEGDDVDGEAEPEYDEAMDNDDGDGTLQQHENGEGVDGQEQNDQEDEEMDPELAEKWRIWDMFTEEFHDITAELPGELHRNLQLMLEYDQQVKKAEQDLEKTLREYATISNTGSYKSAVANAAKAQRVAASASQPPLPAMTAAPISSMHLQGLMNPEPARESSHASENGRDDSVNSDEDVRAALLPDTSRAGAISEAEAAEKLRKLLNDISKQMQITVRAGEDKVALAVTAYNWVDRHIQRLDSDLLKLEDSLSLGLRAGTMPSGDAQEAQTHAKENTTLAALIDGAGTTGGGKADLSTSTDPQSGAAATTTDTIAGDTQVSTMSAPKRPSNSRRKSGKKDRKIKASSQVPPAGFIVIPPDVEVNPLDPKYCYCNQVSYGEMLGCENEDCPREWFHLQCVGLAVAPKGKWWCRDCQAEKGRPKSSTR